VDDAKEPDMTRAAKPQRPARKPKFRVVGFNEITDIEVETYEWLAKKLGPVCTAAAPGSCRFDCTGPVAPTSCALWQRGDTLCRHSCGWSGSWESGRTKGR
jgi:hypothetical protein